MNKEIHTPQTCASAKLAIQDTLEVINGKWKLPILMVVQNGPRRFSELAKEIGITPRMLSKELQDMEMNMLISRTVVSTRPIIVEYAITDYGLSFRQVMDAMHEWGTNHRRKIMGGIHEELGIKPALQP